MPKLAVKRRRRTSEEARAEILEIAARHLAQGGPEAVRLQAIADEMGVTHPAILRHFGSREELLESLLRHAGRELRAALTSALPEDGGAPDLQSFAESLDRIYGGEGYARLSIQLTLSGFRSQGSGMFRETAELLHQSRPRGRRLEETLFAILLLNHVAWADALVGNGFRRALELPADRDTARRFREWVVGLVQERLATE